jgi:hypothetical protein
MTQTPMKIAFDGARLQADEHCVIRLTELSPMPGKLVGHSGNSSAHRPLDSSAGWPGMVCIHAHLQRIGAS